MIFSIEDDLDYIIATDPYIYARYESTLAGMLDSMSPDDMDVLFDQIRLELLPFYHIEEVVAQSRFDKNESSFHAWEDNMQDKKRILKQRLIAMKEELKEVHQ